MQKFQQEFALYASLSSMRRRLLL